MERIAFSDQEMVSCGKIVLQSGEEDVLNYPVSQKENFRAFLRGELPLWVPRYSDTQLFNPAIIPDNIARAFVFETDQPTEKGGKDMFGVSWEFIPDVGGSMVRPGAPLLEDVNDWKTKLRLPDVDSWDWDGCAKRNAQYINPNMCVQSWIFTGFFERLISFMNFEGAAMALIDDEQKDAIHSLFSALSDVYEKIILHLHTQFDVDMIYFHDDWGAQAAPFFSPAVCREMIVPYIKRLSDYCHSLGMFFELHCCGNVEILVPAMIEANVDLWDGQPLNPMTEISKRYGGQIKLAIRIPITPEDNEETRADKFRKFLDDYTTQSDVRAFYMDIWASSAERKLFYKMSREKLNPVK